MKKILIAAVALTLTAVLQVGAVPVNVSTVSGYNIGNGGGEFNINPVIGVGYAASVLVNNGFETFCLARDISIVVPGSYDATVNANGLYTQTAGGATKILSKGTAYLYSQFATGVLATYRYGATSGGTASLRAQDAYELQLAIWTLEGEYSYGGGALDLAGNVFVNAAANTYGGGLAGLAAALAANTPGGSNVGALGLTYLSGPNIGKAAQPMLVLLPDGGTTLMLMGIGFSSLALVSRKLRA